MADASAEEPLSNLSDSSFIILGPGSLQSLSNVNSFANVSDFNPSIDKNQTSLDNLETPVANDLALSKYFEANGDGVDAKLNHLLKENYQLKETLAQNNLAIKSQLNTFFMWQQEVLKTHENHKQKFLETKDLILKLRSENTSLKKQVDEIVQKSFSQNFNDLQLVTSTDYSTNIEVNQKEIDTIKKEIKKYEGMCMELTLENEKLVSENKKLEEDLKITKNEILQLNTDLENLRQNGFYGESKNEYIRNLTENFSSNSDLRIQISNLFKQLEEERAKVAKLQEELNVCKTSFSIPVDPKLNTHEELTKCINKLDNMNISFNKQNERISSMSSWVSLAENNLNTSKKPEIDNGVDCLLLSEIAQLKSHLHQEENAFKKKHETLQEMQNQFYKLLTDYRDLQEKLNLLETDSLQLQQLKEEVQKLSVLSSSKDEELSQKQQECDKLKEDIKKLNLECEEVAILRVQVGLYQSDFNEERQAREKLVGEKEDLAERIRFLENRIKDLEKKDKQKAATDTPESSPTSPLQSGNGNPRYVCPKCTFSFSDLKTCESHVDECLNIHFYP